MSNKYRNYAFLSYCHEDAVVAEELQRKLEHFRLPRGVVNECCDSNRLQPICRKEIEDFGDLSEEIKEELRASKCLILICSPEAADTECVNQAIEFFIAEGRVKQIIPYIVSGQPMCDNSNECFPPALLRYFKENPLQELLGIDTQRISARKAFYSVVATLLDIPYTMLWNRLEKIRRRSIFITSAVAVVAMGLIYYFAVPYRISIRLIDDRHHLPYMRDESGALGVLKMAGISIPVYSLDTTLVSPPIPGYLRGTSVPYSFEATYYLPVVDTIQIGYGLSSFSVQHLHRDNEFEEFSGRVFDLDTGKPILGAWIDVDNGKFWAVTDSMGCFKMNFIIEEQSECKSVRVNAAGYDDYVDDQTIVDKDVSIIMSKIKK